MMAIFADILSWICFLISGFLGISGCIGLLKFPDFYTRLHAVGVTDTLCVAMLILGLMIQSGWSLITVKLILILLLLLLTSPVTSHAIAKAAQQANLKPWRAKDHHHD